MARRSPQKTYAAALRAIQARHSTATYRDAQAIYRMLRRETAAPISARQVRTTRPSTTSKLLTRARALGSRTTPRTAKERAKQSKLARQFNRDNKPKESKPRGKKTTRATRGAKGKTTGRTARRVDDDEGAPDIATAPRDSEVDVVEEEDIDDADAFDRYVDDYEGAYDDVEVETSPDYALGE